MLSAMEGPRDPASCKAVIGRLFACCCHCDYGCRYIGQGGGGCGEGRGGGGGGTV